MAKSLAEAPKAAPARLDPLLAFEAYPTRLLGPETRLSALPDASADRYREFINDPLFSYMPAALPAADLVETILSEIKSGATTPRLIAERGGHDTARIIHAAAVMAKMGLLKA